MTAGTIVTSYQLGIVLQRNTAWGGFSPFHVGVTDADRARHADLYSLIKLIPQEASVAASETIVAHISSRKNAYSLRIGFNDADYLLVRLPSGGEDRGNIINALKSGLYGMQAQKGEFVLFRKGLKADSCRAVPTPVRCLTRLPVSYYFPMIAHAQPQPYGRGHRALGDRQHRLRVPGLGLPRVPNLPCGGRRAGPLLCRLDRPRRLPGGGLSVGLRPLGGDTIGDQNTPVFGPNFVTPFRYHHVDPKDITRHDFVETNGNNCIVVAPVLALLLLVTPKTAGWFFYLCAVMAFTSWFVFCTNQFHKWAHDDHPARWVRALQQAGLILSPEHHAIHHASPQDKAYCITVGWMNPILDRTSFFRICEAIIGRVVPGAVRPS